MKNWIPKNKSVVFAITVAALSVVLYSVSLGVVLFEIKKVENAYKDTESSSARNKRAQALKSIVETNKADIQVLRDFFVHKGDEVRFIEQIEEIGEKSSIKFEIVSIDVKPGQTDAFREDVSIRMNIESSWPKIMNFLDMLDKMYFGVSVQSLNLDVNSSKEWSGSIDFIVSREK